LVTSAEAETEVEDEIFALLKREGCSWEAVNRIIPDVAWKMANALCSARESDKKRAIWWTKQFLQDCADPYGIIPPCAKFSLQAIRLAKGAGW